MRLDQISIENFKGFDSLSLTLDKKFTVFVGENGTGKTTVLDAIATVLAPWKSGITGQFEQITESRIRVVSKEEGRRLFFHEVFPLRIEASGVICGRKDEWGVEYEGRSSGAGESLVSGAASGLFEMAHSFRSKQAEGTSWPILAYYSANRGQTHFDSLDWNGVMRDQPTRLSGYHGWSDTRASVNGFISWFAKQEAIAFQEDVESEGSAGVRSAIKGAVSGARSIRFLAKAGEPVIEWENGSSMPLSKLSHGQQSMIAMVGDIARRAILLNPHLGSEAPFRTEGIVLIDELDLHLHPRWQRCIVDDLKSTFPKIQFTATTHSPFIIQSLEPGELRILGGEEPKIEYSNRGLEEIVRFIQGVDMPHTSERYAEQKKAAKSYFDMLRDGKTADDPEVREAKLRLDSVTAHMSDNPALDAMIESKTQASSAMVNED